MSFIIFARVRKGIFFHVKKIKIDLLNVLPLYALQLNYSLLRKITNTF